MESGEVGKVCLKATHVYDTGSQKYLSLVFEFLFNFMKLCYEVNLEPDLDLKYAEKLSCVLIFIALSFLFT